MSEQGASQDFPIGPNQRRYLLAERFTAASYMIAVAHPVAGALDPDRLQRAAHALVTRHAVLRSRFVLKHGEYRAVVDPDPAFAFHVVDLPDDAFETFRAAALPLVMRAVDVGAPASLVRFVVGRVAGGQRWRVCFAAHHAVSDGVSRSLAMKQLFQLYDGRELPPCRSFYEFVGSGEAPPDDLTFWRDATTLAPEALTLVPDRESEGEAGLGEFVADRLDVSATEFRRLVGQVSASKFACLAAAYTLGLLRMTGGDRLLFTFQSAGRASVGAPVSVFGPFSNTLPLVAEVRLGESFAALAERLERQIAEAVAHEALPYDAILQGLPDKPIFSLNLFPKELPPAAKGLAIAPREFLDRQTEYALNLVWSEDGADLVCRGFYDAQRYSAARIADALAAQKTILRLGLEAPQRPVRDILAALGGEAVPFDPASLAPLHETVLDRFVTHAAGKPDAIALRTGAGSWTYGELVSRANRFADLLLARGLAPGDRVAIVASRGPEVVAALLGAARAGASFAVLDASYPLDRLSRQIDLLRPRFGFILDDEGDGLDALRAAHPAVTWLAADAAAPAAERYPGPSEGSPLYFLFTSGTTGEPKCVGHGPEILTLYAAWERDTFSITADDCVSLLSGLNHDPVMRDLFVPLAAGAALAIPGPEVMADPPALRNFLREQGVTVAHLTPPLGRLLAMDAEPGSLGGLRLLVWGGDELPGHQARRIRALAPDATQVNLYGTSETSQAAALFVLPPEASIPWRTVPIGRSVDWMRCDCVTPEGRVCGLGEVGTLRVSMPYPVFVLERAEADSEEPAIRPRTVQDTGDRAVVLPTGDLLFAGRLDDQVKIRGYRVELGDVSAALRSLPGVSETMVLVDRRDAGDPSLVAFCVPKGGALLDTVDLRRALRRKLPGSMIPARIVPIARMPLLPNGKLDRHALLALVDREEKVSTPAPKAGARTAAESQVAAILAKATGRSVSDLGATLQDLGADSLSMIQARLALEEAGYRLPEGWEARPVAELASFAPEVGSRRPSWLRMANLESFIAVRAVAICLIVSLHFKLFVYDGGATSALLVIAGIIFAKFSLGRVVVEDSARPVWTFLLKIVVAFYPLTLVITALRVWRGLPVHHSLLSFTANLFSDTPNQDVGRFIFLWYIHCYVQIVLILAVLLSFASVRARLREAPFATVLQGLALATALFTGLALLMSVWPADPLLFQTRMPTHGLMLVLTGMMLVLADTPRRMAAAFLAALAVLGLRVWLTDGDDTLLVAGSILVLAAVPMVAVPAPLARLMATISGASLFIYLLHQPLRGLASRLIDLDAHPLVATVGTIAVSAVLWRLWLPVVESVVRWIVRAVSRRTIADASPEQGI